MKRRYPATDFHVVNAEVLRLAAIDAMADSAGALSTWCMADLERGRGGHQAGGNDGGEEDGAVHFGQGRNRFCCALDSLLLLASLDFIAISPTPVPFGPLSHVHKRFSYFRCQSKPAGIHGL
jgi:hypothetical protein